MINCRSKKCQYYGFLHDNYLNIDNHICKHPKVRMGKKGYRLISDITFIKGIPNWCPLEDYNENNKSF